MKALKMGKLKRNRVLFIGIKYDKLFTRNPSVTGMTNHYFEGGQLES